MPTHVHVLITPLHGESLSAILHAWKSFTAKQANAALERQGTFWQEEYFDRVIRDEAHFLAQISYIHENPVKAGLCGAAEEWAFSSAGGEDWRAGRPPPQDDIRCHEGGTGAAAYADAVATYLAFSVSKASTRSCALTIWEPGMGRLAGAMGRQALPMQWNFAETNPLAGAGGGYCGNSHICRGKLGQSGIWRSRSHS